MANNYGGNFPSFDEYLSKNKIDRGRRRAPFYDDNADYNTNSKSYYDDLARKEKLFQILAKRIWEYDEELAKRFEEWDKNLEEFPEDVKKLLEKWLKDGTLADIINKEIFKDLNDLIKALSIDVAKNTNDIKELEKLDYKTRKLLYQKKAMNLDLGNPDNPLFDGSEKANQGMAYIKYKGKEYLFLLSRVYGSAWQEDELQRISMFEYNNNGITKQPIHVSKDLSLGHQGLAAFIEDGELYLIAGMYNQKGYTKVKWRDSETCQEDVKDYRLLNDNDTTGDQTSIFYNNTPSTDINGNYIVMSGSTTMAGGLRYVLVYRRQDVECAPDPREVPPLNIFKITPPAYNNANVVQDIAVDDNFIYVLSGYNGYKEPIIITTYGMSGNLIGYVKVDTVYNEYTDEQLKDEDLIIEPEGLSLRGNNVLAQVVHNEKIDDCMTHNKYVYELSNYKMDSNSKSINSGVLPVEVPSNIHLHGNPNDISLTKGDALQISYYDFETREFSNVINYNREHILNIYDNREGVNNDQHVIIAPYYQEDEQYTIIRADRSNEYGAGINLATNSYGSDGSLTLIASTPDSDNTYRVLLSGSFGHLRPQTDGEQDIGSSGYHWDTGYIDEIQSKSDARFKRDIKDLNVGLNLINKLRPVSYKRIKGQRDHYGIVAQELKEVMDDLDIDFGGYQDHNIKDDNDILTVGYMELIAPLIKSVQELSKEVKQLKGEE